MNKKKLKEDIEAFAGKCFGFELIISPEENNKDYSNGFQAGKDYMRKEIFRILDSDNYE